MHRFRTLSSRRQRLFFTLPFVVILIAVTLSTLPGATAAPVNGSGLYYDVVTRVAGLPTNFDFLPDGTPVGAEKSGRIWSGTGVAETIGDISPLVNDYWDRGLLDVVPDPQQANSFFVLYTVENAPQAYEGCKPGALDRITVANGSVVSRVPILGTVRPPTVCPTSEATVCPGAQSDCMPNDFRTHAVGNIEIANDGTLFVSVGEGGSTGGANDASMRAQDDQWLAGKLLHVDRDGKGLASNPRFNGNVNDNVSKVWAKGLRNPFRFTLHPATQLPVVGDVGWGSQEEITSAPSGSNLGWPCYEGSSQQSAYAPREVCQALYRAGPSAVVAPIHEWPHQNGVSAAATGGAFITGDKYPAKYQNAYVFGDYAADNVSMMGINGAGALTSPAQFVLQEAGGPVAFRMGPDGYLYYLSITTGELRRLRYSDECAADPARCSSPTPAATGGYVASIESPEGTTRIDASTAQLSFSGFGLDASGARVPESLLLWDLVNVHCGDVHCTQDHEHVVRSATGSTGVLPLPTEPHGEHQFFRIRLTVRDVLGSVLAVSAVDLHPPGDTVVIAWSDDFPDALTMGAAGARLGAPVLLTGSDGLPPVVAAELTRIDPRVVYIAGGESRVPPAVAASIAVAAPSAQIARVAGPDRASTALAVSEQLFGSCDRAIVASGDVFPDALAAGVLSAQWNAPIFLAGGDLPAASLVGLRRCQPVEVVVVGGVGRISAATEASIAAAVPGASVRRIAGADRFDTARLVAGNVTAPGSTVILASGEVFPDALASVAIAGRDRAPILLTGRDALPAATREAIAQLNPSRILVVGGSARIGDAVAAEAGQVGSATVDRVAGATRFETAALLSRLVIP